MHSQGTSEDTSPALRRLRESSLQKVDRDSSEPATHAPYTMRVLVLVSEQNSLDAGAEQNHAGDVWTAFRKGNHEQPPNPDYITHNPPGGLEL